ncbi:MULTISPECIES: hypothetical protein [unclassified Rhizobium]|uniref:hypothetical protein n=1 Tax=unclassified Rhizobium TaxID=2613769 RepID=UPI0007F0E980|nr:MULTISPECIES: hypothetical protein [unclassified Rhizobium]ANL11960.1 hypothetical protein AMJ98_PA00014 [Rhizobium sp. N1341]ANM42805.1 hypothetical protein AMK03_PA00014 [Rhizobium sp. N741]
MATIQHQIFGPDTNATVTISGKAVQIEIHHPKRRTMVIPGDWASTITGTDDEILKEVSLNLNGAKVAKA